MVRVITQETYDDVVKENMNEFDMSPEEAIKEAIAQFEAQGVDLSNIIKDLNLNTGEEHLVSLTVKKLKELSNAGQNNDDMILEQLDILMGMSNSGRRQQQQLQELSSLSEIPRPHRDRRQVEVIPNNMKPPLVCDMMCTIACLLVRHELCALAAERGATLLFTVLADNYDDVTVIHQATKLITALAGNDDVKRQLVKCGIVPIIVSLLSRFASNATVTAQTLRCVSALALREPAHGRLLLDCGAPEPLAHCLKLHPRNAAVQVTTHTYIHTL
ncbi:Armadillo repeat-containing protein 6-like [Papilio machaon]|uniref:Armadillo repeat-containing protein 6-like n=1 Tax=Papilio machaon TaxID=76193 RepID=A0A0N1IHX5_PAPMA|nr:Armadillo repeat-containing protein 6-like [Papilio machaon]